ncbi:hypothetical protein [Flavobacterium collinsii]|nr:hypothetical protein [Flavobacterium collinsii]
MHPAVETAGYAEITEDAKGLKETNPTGFKACRVRKQYHHYKSIIFKLSN